MVQLTARVEAPAPARREFLQALLTWSSEARREAGVLDAHLYEDIELPTAFYVVAQWESRNAMEAHLRGRTFGALNGALDVLAARPTFQILEVGDNEARDSLAAIRRLREGGGVPTPPEPRST